ncbi:MAG: YhcH/YjgK/YiaL family protein [Bacillota bacterium]|nr:YhcH/YjgK/YiaL family protein [Bacillota bacterium]
MVVDRIERLGFYAALDPAIPIIVRYLEKTDLKAVPAGRRELTGGIGLIREAYLTKPVSDCTLEGHLRHADLQIVLEGAESMGWVSRSLNLHQVTSAYDPSKDVEKYQVRRFSRVDLSAGMFALVFPDDLHMPKIMQEETTRVEKAVFKIPLQEE